jgi:hypothetical protein
MPRVKRQLVKRYQRGNLMSKANTVSAIEGTFRIKER